MAIPQFAGFRAKARSAEAKTNLGAMYTAQKAYFFEESDYDEHLQTVGFAKPEGTLYYTIGFRDTAVCILASGTIAATTTCVHASSISTAVATTLATTCIVDNSASPKTFLSCAKGDGSTDGREWTMNQLKNLAVR